jgi:hypothetical protein
MKSVVYINEVLTASLGRIARFGLLSVLALLSACSHIDDDQRLIKMDVNVPTGDPTEVTRNVLLEDFTGQRCVNCPKGAKVIEQLQESDFGERVIAVGIYSGPFGKNASGALLPLSTQTGCDYYDHWQIESQPGAIINRSGHVYYSPQDWTREVMAALGGKSAVKMDLEAVLHDGNIEIAVHSQGYGHFAGKLQVWVVEDGIVALQLLPDAPEEDPAWKGGSDPGYVHNHVFRAAVNGSWGEDFAISTGEQKSNRMQIPAADAWNTDHLSVVAFVCNGKGVEQVVKGKVKTEK